MSKKVLVTGGAGRIGRIIYELLGGYHDFTFVDVNGSPNGPRIRRLDLVTDYVDLTHALLGMDVVIHLAWNPGENWKSRSVVPDNKLIAENVYSAAMAAGVKRVVMASSIHADNFYDWPVEAPLMSCGSVAVPRSLYGATKVYIEALGRYYAATGKTEVVCVRFGGVTLDDVLRDEPGYEKIWLSRRDCAELVHKCIEAESVPKGFCAM